MRKVYDKNVSPVGWYYGSCLLRFVELESDDNDVFVGIEFDTKYLNIN